MCHFGLDGGCGERFFYGDFVNLVCNATITSAVIVDTPIALNLSLLKGSDVVETVSVSEYSYIIDYSFIFKASDANRYTCRAVAASNDTYLHDSDVSLSNTETLRLQRECIAILLLLLLFYCYFNIVILLLF